MTVTALENISESKLEGDDCDEQTEKNELPSKPYKMQIIWQNVALMIAIHILFFWGLIQIPFVKTKTVVFSYILTQFSTMAATVGVHRLWSHRSYKANFGVRLFLMICQTISLQFSIFDWAHYHRVHHKWQETDADPHNSDRGFFFAHYGWFMVKNHPEVDKKLAMVDVSDLHADSIVAFQRKYYIPLVVLFWGALPIAIPVYLWGETQWNTFLVVVMFRWVLVNNGVWAINSWAHMLGNRPYDQKLAAVDVSIYRELFFGDGHHNYHHAFPWDYSQSEFGALDVYNPSTVIINFWHYMGWAWDLKKAKQESVDKRRNATGDPDLAYTPGGFFLKYTIGTIGTLGPLILMLFIHYVFKPATYSF